MIGAPRRLALDGGNVLAFARGGIVHDPTLFRFARTTRRGSSASRPAPIAKAGNELVGRLHLVQMFPRQGSG